MEKTEETRPVKTAHTLLLTDRKKARITGVYGILRFDDECVVLDVGEKSLCLEGEGLVIDCFGKDTGEVEITGRTDSVYYSESAAKSRRGGFFRRLGARDEA